MRNIFFPHYLSGEPKSSRDNNICDELENQLITHYSTQNQQVTYECDE